MIYQAELSIINDSLDIKIKFLNSDTSKNSIKKLNANEILKDSNINEDMNLESFKYYYEYLIGELKQTSDFACKKVICTSLSFNKKIPLHEIKISNNLNLSSNKDEIEQAIKQSLKDDITTIYYCNDRTDLIIACIYHFINNGYRLKKCPICNNWFLENINAKIKYCDFDKIDDEKKCTKKGNSINSFKNRKNNPIAIELKRIQDMLQARTTKNEMQKFNIEYQTIRDSLTNDELLNWLKNKHNELKIKKG